MGSRDACKTSSIDRVYDPEGRKIVQKNVGHTDSVRSIIHVPERSQVRVAHACAQGSVSQEGAGE